MVYRQIAAGVGILVNIFEMWLTEYIQKLLKHRSWELILIDLLWVIREKVFLFCYWNDSGNSGVTSPVIPTWRKDQLTFRG